MEAGLRPSQEPGPFETVAQVAHRLLHSVVDVNHRRSRALLGLLNLLVLDSKTPNAPALIISCRRENDVRRRLSSSNPLADAILTAVYDNRLPGDECSIFACQK